MAEIQRILYPWQRMDADVKLAVHLLKTRGYAGRITGVHGVPRGGQVFAAAVAASLGLPLVSDIGPDVLVVDDIVDSGSTRARYPENPFLAIFQKKYTPKDLRASLALYEIGDEWVEFWWEPKQATPEEDALFRLLQAINMYGSFQKEQTYKVSTGIQTSLGLVHVTIEKAE